MMWGRRSRWAALCSFNGKIEEGWEHFTLCSLTYATSVSNVEGAGIRSLSPRAETITDLAMWSMWVFTRSGSGMRLYSIVFLTPA